MTGSLSDADDVRAVEAEWLRCIEAGAADDAARLLADDYQLVVLEPTRAVSSRAQWLESLAGFDVHDYRVEEELVHVRGNMAIVLQRVHTDATIFGRSRSGVLVVTDVWRRAEHGAWRLWRRHATPLDRHSHEKEEP